MLPYTEIRLTTVAFVHRQARKSFHCRNVMEAVDDEMKYSVVNTRVYRINRIETFMVGHSGQYCLLLKFRQGTYY